MKGSKQQGRVDAATTHESMSRHQREYLDGETTLLCSQSIKINSCNNNKKRFYQRDVIFSTISFAIQHYCLSEKVTPIDVTAIK